MEKDSTWLRPTSKIHDDRHDDVLHQYHCWMREVYGQCQQQLLCQVLHPEPKVAVSCCPANSSHLPHSSSSYTPITPSTPSHLICRSSLWMCSCSCLPVRGVSSRRRQVPSPSPTPCCMHWSAFCWRRQGMVTTC